MEELIPTLQEEGEERIDTLQESSIIAGVQTINGKAGDLNLKTINGQDILTAGNLDLATAEQLATKQDTLTAGANIQIENNVISATDSRYTAGNGLALNGSEFSIDENVVATKTDLSAKQDKLTQAQLTAVNSGIDSAKVAQITTNQGDISTINGKIPNQASTTNQLADKAFVNSSVQTATANFRGSWADWDSVPASASQYPADYTGSTTPTVNDYMVIQDASDYPYESLEGTWRFKYTGSWGNDGKEGWQPEYQVNETPMTAAQLAALNSGITAPLVDVISENQQDIASLQTGKMDANTTFWGQNVQNGAVDGTLTITESGQTAAIETTGHNASDAAIRMGNSQNYVEAGLSNVVLSSTSGDIQLKPKSGSSVDATNAKIVNLATPTANSDAATKKYVDDGLAAKQDTLTAGAGIDITANVVSATDPAPAGFWTGAGTKISEGTDITIQNALATSPKNINLKGDTQQTTYTGKNLWNNSQVTAVSDYVVPTETGIKIIKTDNGRISPEYAIKLTANTRYTISCELTKTTAGAYMYCQWITDGGTTIWTPNILSGSTAITPSDNIKGVKFYVQSNETNGAYVELTNLQIEAGSTATSYEPYVGGLPSPSPDYPEPVNAVTGTQTVYEVGKNWLEQTETDWSFSTTNNKIGQTAGRYAQWGKIEGGKYYTMSRKAVGSSSYWVVAFTTGVPHTDTTAIGWARPTSYNVTEYTFETPAEAKYAVVFYGAGLSDEGQVELGSTATAYEPYHGGTYSVRLGSLELCKIGTYQDYIYTDGTGWWKHTEVSKIKLTGSESWSESITSGTLRFFYATVLTNAYSPNSTTDTALLFSDYYLPASRDSVQLRQVDYGVTNLTNTLRIRNKDQASAADFKTWLSTHNTTVYYALATATDELIVDADLISDLDALLAAKLATGQNTITNSAVSPNLPAIINVETFENNWNGLSEALLEA